MRAIQPAAAEGLCFKAPCEPIGAAGKVEIEGCSCPGEATSRAGRPYTARVNALSVCKSRESRN